MVSVLNLSGHDLRLDNIIKAENCVIFDGEGSRYLDLESGIWCTSIGHSNPAVTRTIADNAGAFMHAGYCYNASVVDSSAGKVLGITGHKNGKCVFLCSGSEAVDLAITVSLHVTGKRKVLTLSDSYLSAFGHFANPDEIIKYDWLDGDAVNIVPYGEIAAFVFEPGSSSGLVRFPGNALIASIAEKVRDSGGVVIANEVTTGIGRTGKWFGFEHYSISPDIVAIGKGLGNGYPVSCVSCSEEIAGRIDLSRFHYSQSHQNDPLGASVALCVMDTIEKCGLLERADEVGRHIRINLGKIREKHGLIKDIRNRGLMFAVEFLPVENRSISREVTDSLFRKRIILTKRPGSEVIRFDPALTIEYDDVDYFLDAFGNILKEISVADKERAG